MKHKKEWYTCDRCGKKVDEIPSNVIDKISKWFKFGKPVEIMMLTADKTGYVSSTKLIMPDVCSAEIIEYYKEKRRNIYLCGKCRKEFERFMNGKYF